MCLGASFLSIKFSSSISPTGSTITTEILRLCIYTEIVKCYAAKRNEFTTGNITKLKTKTTILILAWTQKAYFYAQN